MLGLEQVFLPAISVLSAGWYRHKSLPVQKLRANFVSRVKNVIANAFAPSFATALA